MWLPPQLGKIDRHTALGVTIAGELAVSGALLFSPPAPGALFGLSLFIALLTLYGSASIKATGACGCFGGVNQANQEGIAFFAARNAVLTAAGTLALMLSPPLQVWERGTPLLGASLSALLAPWLALALLSAALSLVQRRHRGRKWLRDVRWWLARHDLLK
jgi:hypothetical protein